MFSLSGSPEKRRTSSQRTVIPKSPRNNVLSQLLNLTENITEFTRVIKSIPDNSLFFADDRYSHIQEILMQLALKKNAALAIELINKINIHTSKTSLEESKQQFCFDVVNLSWSGRSEGEDCFSFKLVKHMIEKGFDPGCIKDGKDALAISSKNIIEKMGREEKAEDGDIKILVAMLASGKITDYRESQSWQNEVERIHDLYNQENHQRLKSLLKFYGQRSIFSDPEEHRPLTYPVKLGQSFTQNLEVNEPTIEHTSTYPTSTYHNLDNSNITPSTNPEVVSGVSFLSRFCQSISSCFGLSRN